MMSNNLLKLITIVNLLAATIFIIWSFANYMSATTKHVQVEQFNQCHGITPLYVRFQGYNKDDVMEFYDKLSHANKDFLQYEKEYQSLDLYFPLVYGGALAFCIYILAFWLGRPNSWLISPVIITMIADWLENSIMLKQLNFYLNNESHLISAQAICVASSATVLKIFCLITSILICVFLSIVLVNKVFCKL